MPLSELPVELLFTAEFKTADVPYVSIRGGPQGTRTIATVSGGSFEGPKLRGTLPASVAAGDWVTVRDNGSVRLDVKIVLETDDGAHILMQYSGIGVRTDDGLDIRSAPQFETGDEKYAWLNDVQAIGVGHAGRDSVTYDIYQVL